MATTITYDKAHDSGSGSPPGTETTVTDAGPGPNAGAGLSEDEAIATALQSLEAKNKKWYSYFRTAEFWTVLALGQVLSLCITATNTFTTFLAIKGTNIPAFQTLFNYVLLTLIYVPATVYMERNGLAGAAEQASLRTRLLRDGWRYFVLAFLDVQGNYFTVLAYRYTNILSAQLLNFWSIVCVVTLSFFFLRVRYRPFQVAGILTCCAGMGILLASDHITGANGGAGVDMVKGDLFGLLGATCYGLSNVFEEWFVSRRPATEVLAALGVLGACINGVQAAIFDRPAFASAVWDGQVGGYLTGYTLALTLFYSLAPIVLRMASAAFFDISLLTGNFWGVIVGVHVFGYAVHFLYPVAFVLIVLGLVLYFLAGSVLGDSKKPWLGAAQRGGVEGLGTARRRAVREARRLGLVVGSREGQVVGE